MWAVATLITALLLVMAASASTRLAAPSGGSAGAATSVAGENTIAFDIDRLLRGERRGAEAGDITATRAEVARILLTSSGHSGVAAEEPRLSCTTREQSHGTGSARGRATG